MRAVRRLMGSSQWNVTALSIEYQCKADYPQRLYEAPMSWRLIGYWLGGRRISLPANSRSTAMRFPRQQNADDEGLNGSSKHSSVEQFNNRNSRSCCKGVTAAAAVVMV